MTADLRLHPIPPSRRPRREGEFVLYWIQATLRACDNFALNFAVEEANARGLPVLVYQGLRHDYPHANDRIHTFILESALDLDREFERWGIQYVFYLDTRLPRGVTGGNAGSGSTDTTPIRPGSVVPPPALPHRRTPRHVTHPSPLVRLARRAALVVTDFFPTFIVPKQTAGLAKKIDAPVVAVDSCGVVPLAALDQAFSSARAIRPRLHGLLPHYLHPVGDAEPVVRRVVEVDFDAVDLKGIRSRDPGREAVRQLLAECAIDHSIARASEFPGGTAAARQRLERFLQVGLPRYDADRGDPNQPEATSRLSPYLHFGNISMQEVLLRAREAGPAPQYEKFQDEALIWRELAYNFAWRNPRHRSAAEVPDWARRELDDHAADPRPRIYRKEELETAATADALWNYAQHSYLHTGFMHNYLRMLWGKTVIQWTRSWRHAFRVLREINDKYALDGRDPNTYAGIHWCFGRFDRPFYRRPVYGTVRYMSTRAAERRFDVSRLLGVGKGE